MILGLGLIANSALRADDLLNDKLESASLLNVKLTLDEVKFLDRKDESLKDGLLGLNSLQALGLEAESLSLIDLNNLSLEADGLKA